MRTISSNLAFIFAISLKGHSGLPSVSVSNLLHINLKISKPLAQVCTQFHQISPAHSLLCEVSKIS